jgi:hypothetical protein
VRDRTPTLDVTPELPSAHTTRIAGWRLMVARGLVLATMIATAGLFVLALPGLVDHLASPCADAVRLTGPERCLITPEMVAPLAGFGLTPAALATVIVICSYLVLLLVEAIAAVVLLRRSNDWMALLVSLTLVLLPPSFTPVLQGLSGIWQLVGQVLATASGVTFFLLLGLFPSGRFAPRWLWAPLSVVIIVGLPLPPASNPALISIMALVALGIVITLVAGQIYRYRHVSTALQRQQTKWAVYGLVLSVALIMLFWLPFVLIPALNRPSALYVVLKYPGEELAVAILAVMFGVAILRYRLYDIDVIIRRTLVYGSLTGILALVYIGGIVGMQSLVNTIVPHSGSDASPVFIVVTTLAIAALAQPLRHRIQAFIDRRFYRRKYVAARTLEAFSATMRNEVDLAELHQHLLAVVQETMQPTHVSLWLRRPVAARQTI